MLDKTVIEKQLTDKDIEIKLFQSIDSTNNYLKSVLKNKKITICLAEQQTQGKGRFDRTWHSPFGLNLYYSCLYRFNKNISELAGLSLVVGLAVVKTLQSYLLPKPLWIKWPNDLIYENQKLAGILIETNAKSNGQCSVIIGIGLNVNMTSDSENHITQEWISLRRILNHDINRNELAANLTNHLIDYLDRFGEKGLVFFQEEWKKSDYLWNREISVNHLESQISGKAKGINDQGNLLIETKEGVVKAFSSGDTTLLK